VAVADDGIVLDWRVRIVTIGSKHSINSSAVIVGIALKGVFKPRQLRASSAASEWRPSQAQGIILRASIEIPMRPVVSRNRFPEIVQCAWVGGTIVLLHEAASQLLLPPSHHHSPGILQMAS
jgi:hypothetical protein